MHNHMAELVSKAEADSIRWNILIHEKMAGIPGTYRRITSTSSAPKSNMTMTPLASSMRSVKFGIGSFGTSHYALSA